MRSKRVPFWTQGSDPWAICSGGSIPLGQITVEYSLSHAVQDWRAELQPGVFKPCLQLSITFGSAYSTANAVVAEYRQNHGNTGTGFKFGQLGQQPERPFEGWAHDEADLPKIVQGPARSG